MYLFEIDYENKLVKLINFYNDFGEFYLVQTRFYAFNKILL
jgi:hypothetical protein